MVIENKVEKAFVQKIVPQAFVERVAALPLVDRALRIGYFGLLRDEWSWNVLEMLASRNPDSFEIVFAGLPISPKDIPQRVLKYANIKYLGEYRSPADLPNLYRSIDKVWACYRYIEPFDWNLRWTIPNRFFESCAFKKPVFARLGCPFCQGCRTVPNWIEY